MMKLKIELVPKPLWGINLRRVFGETDWNVLSRSVRGNKGFKCEICGWEEDRKNRKYTHCHEVWKYDDENKVQSLERFECLCPDCHAVHHWGHSKVTGRDMDALQGHAMAVNNCTKEEWEEHIQEETFMWHVRSVEEWVTEGFEDIINDIVTEWSGNELT